MQHVAVVGLGIMGSRIARRLLDAGHPTSVWNRSPDRADPLVAAGAKAAATPAQAAADADVTIIMVADPAALADVTEGPDGVLAGCAPGTVVVQMSTVSPEATSRLASLMPPGTALLDAPVVGSVPHVESGTLGILAGGPEPVLRDVAGPLSTVGTASHVGDVGAGTAAKLVANSTLVATSCLLGEALTLAQRLGLAPEQAFEVLEQTHLSGLAGAWRPMLDSGEHPPRFPLALAAKDAGLVTRVAAATGTDLPICGAAAGWLSAAAEAGRGAENVSAVVDHIIGSGRKAVGG